MLDHELSERSRALLDAIVKGPVAWVGPSALAGALGWDEGETMDRLSDLDVGGWVEVRDEGPDGPTAADGGPSVALSALGAERLGLRLVEVGVNAALRWANPDEPEPPAPRARNVIQNGRSADLEYVPDRAPRPEADAVRSERAARVVKAVAATPRPRPPARPEPLTPPSLIIGVGLTPWPGPEQGPDPGEACPACGSRKLRPNDYCLCCDRWGLDHLAPVVPLSSPPVGAPAVLDALDRAEADRLRSRRKARRRHRSQAGPGGA